MAMFTRTDLITDWCMKCSGGKIRTYQWFVSNYGSRCTTAIGPIKVGKMLCTLRGFSGSPGTWANLWPLRCFNEIPNRISGMWYCREVLLSHRIYQQRGITLPLRPRATLIFQKFNKKASHLASWLHHNSRGSRIPPILTYWIGE